MWRALSVLAAVCALTASTSITVAADELGTGDFPDPFVVYADGHYVGFGTSTRAADGSLLRVPTLRSDDLKAWTPTGDALVGAPVWASPRASLWAPAALAVADGWRLFYSALDVGSGTRCLSVATAPVVTGPYQDKTSAPLVCDVDHGGAMDPEAFTDSKGRHWLLWKSEGRPGNEARLWSQQLAADGLTLVGEPHALLARELGWEIPVVENPSMIERDGRFLLFYSGGDWRTSGYAIGVAACDSPIGPCRRVRDTPLQASVGPYAGPGGGAVFVDQHGVMRLALHTWTAPRVGYDEGGARTMLVAAAEGGGARLGLGRSPVGALDQVTSEGGSVRVRGWTLDRDVHGPIDVHVYVDQTGAAIASANHLRPDVEAAHRGSGASHGYDLRVDVGPGPHRVCAYGINVALGENRSLGCAQVA